MPLVLNTSFNEHEPIVATPGDALACYLKTRMDVLALGNWVLTRASVSRLNGRHRMKTAVVAFILSMLCGTILTPIVRRLAHRFGALDHARSSRKIHGKPIPRLGGIAIVIAFYAPLVGLLIFQTEVGQLFLAEREHVIGLFVGGLAIALLGLYDDLRGANAWKKFLVQFAVAGLLYRSGLPHRRDRQPVRGSDRARLGRACRSRCSGSSASSTR